MADDVIIRAEGLGKKYVIGHQSGERYTALRDVMARAAKNFARTTQDMLRSNALVAGDETEEFWALKDVSFEIKRGDVVGVIGSNGAGKSTLLKLLSRITEPTTGRVTVNGRVASLLEVGTGFHPELSGRENIYLNGAILGMARGEIARKFDEIVDFAGVDKFLDTPVKRYSSGMYVRLAFSVAAHIEPEILVLDEVLSVGDVEFQKKCLGKMQDVAGAGRTVIFVSHNLSAVAALCGRGLVFHQGHLQIDGDITAAIERYMTRSGSASDYYAPPAKTSHTAYIRSANLNLNDDELLIKLVIWSANARSVILNARLRDAVGAPIGMASLGGFDPDTMIKLQSGIEQVGIRISLPVLATGTYFVDLDLEEHYGHFLERLNDKLSFDVLRIPKSAYGRVLQLSWGVGCIEMAGQAVTSCL